MIVAGVSQSAEQRTKNVRVEGYESSDPKKEIWGERDRKRENRRFASILKKTDALERKLYVLLSKEGQPIPALHLCNDHSTPKPKHFDSDAQMTIATTATRTGVGLPVVMSLEC